MDNSDTEEDSDEERTRSRLFVLGVAAFLPAPPLALEDQYLQNASPVLNASTAVSRMTLRL